MITLIRGIVRSVGEEDLTLAVEPFQALTMQASIDLLPDWARRMHGLAGPGIATPLVRTGGRAIYLGIYLSEEAAALAYDRAAEALWGPFACLNLPGETGEDERLALF